MTLGKRQPSKAARGRSNVFRADSYSYHSSIGAVSERAFPLRILSSGISIMRREHHPRKGQTVTLWDTNKVKQWAHDNAYTLIFLSGMFIVTWIILAILIWKN